MIKFMDNSNFIISGSSCSGKTTLIKRILLNTEHLFVTEPTKIIFCFQSWQKSYEDILKLKQNVTFIETLPTEEGLIDLITNHPHTIFVCDDKMNEIMDNKFYSELFTRNSHHLKISSFLLLQNINSHGKYKSNIIKNSHYHLLLRSPSNLSSIRALGIQVGDYRNLIDSYNDCTKNKQFSYLLCDFHPQTDQTYRYRTDIFPDDDVCIVYKTM